MNITTIEPTTMNKKNTRDIQLSVELDASPEDVFRAVTDGTEIAKWLAPEARVTPPDGGKKGTIWVSWGEGMEGGVPQRTFLTHGEPEAANAMAGHIKDKFGWNVHVPQYGERVELV